MKVRNTGEISINKHLYLNNDYQCNNEDIAKIYKYLNIQIYTCYFNIHDKILA